MKLLGDFPSVRGDQITLSLDYVVGASALVPERGTRVVVDDTEGHTAEAVVLGVRSRNIDALIDWSTWRDEVTRDRFDSVIDFGVFPRFESSTRTSATYDPVRMPLEFSGAR